MDKADSLFELIKSLTKSEKRYFKRFTLIYSSGKQNNYLKLFNEIEKQNVYNESLIRKKYKNEKFVKQLSVTKEYLYNMILKSLNLYNTKKNFHIKIRELISNTELLFLKRLFSQSYKELIKAKDYAYSHEFYLQILEILGDELLVLRELNFPDEMKRLEEIEKEENRVLTEIMNIRMLLSQYRKLSAILHSEGVPVINCNARNKIKNIMSHPVFIQGKSYFSSEANSLFYHSFISSSLAFNDMPGAYKYSRELIMYIEQNPQNMSLRPRNYFSCLFNTCEICIELGKLDESKIFFTKLTDFMNSFIRTSEFNRFTFYINFIILKLRINNLFGGELTNNELDDIHETINRYSNKDKNYLIPYYLNLAISCFINKNYQKSIVYLNYILKNEYNKIRKDILITTRLLLIIVQFELKNYDYLEYIIISTYKYLLKNKEKPEPELLLLKIFKKLGDVHNERELISLLKYIKGELDLLENLISESTMSKYFDFKAWLESKVSEKEFSEIIKSNLKN